MTRSMRTACQRLPRVLRHWLWILACLPHWAIGEPAPQQPVAELSGPLHIAKDLFADARLAQQRRVPLLILYSRPDCTWCERARREYLVPLKNDPASADRVLMRQIDLDSDAALIDFAGRATTQRVFAAGERVRLTPTLMLYDGDGRSVAEPIVGFLLPDFYAARIDRAIDDGLAALRRSRP